MSRRSELPRDLPLDGFTLAEARAVGVNRNRTRARDLETPFRGVRAAAGSRAETGGLIRAYAARMPAGNFFSHETAARLLGVLSGIQCTSAPACGSSTDSRRPTR